MSDEERNPEQTDGEPSVEVDPELLAEGDAVEAVEAEIEAQMREQEEMGGDQTDLTRVVQVTEAEVRPTEPEETEPVADEETEPVADEETEPVADEETEPVADEETEPVIDERHWPKYLAAVLITLMVIAVVIALLVGSCEGTKVVGNEVSGNISKVVPHPAPPAKAPVVATPVPTPPAPAPNQQTTLPPPPALPDDVDPSTVAPDSVDLTRCRPSGWQVVEENGRSILRTTYICPRSAVSE